MSISYGVLFKLNFELFGDEELQARENLDHGSWWIRRTAASTLAGFSNSTNASLIKAKLGTESAKWVQKQLIKSLGLIGLTGITEVSAFKNSDDDELRQEAITAMSKLGTSAQISTDLKAKLTDPKVGIRRAAVEALAKIGDINNATDLRNTITDSDYKVRQKVIEALASFVDTASEAAIIARTIDDISYVRKSAVQALGTLKQTTSVEALVNSASNKTEHFFVRDAALSSLQTIGDTSNTVSDCLLDIIENPNEEPRLQAKAQTVFSALFSAS